MAQWFRHWTLERETQDSIPARSVTPIYRISHNSSSCDSWSPTGRWQVPHRYLISHRFDCTLPLRMIINVHIATVLFVAQNCVCCVAIKFKDGMKLNGSKWESDRGHNWVKCAVVFSRRQAISHWLPRMTIETVSAGGRSTRPARLGVHLIWWRWHGNTKSLSKVQSSDV